MRSKVSRARDQIETLRLSLLTPEPDRVQAAVPGLEEAVRFLGEVEQELRGGNIIPLDLRDECRSLQRELTVVTRLIQQGSAFYHAWARMLSAAAGGYTPQGQPASIDQWSRPAGSLSVDG